MWKKRRIKITFLPSSFSFLFFLLCSALLRLSQVIEFDDGSGSVLRIQPLRIHRDEAIYECTATNSAGEINTSAKLTVLEGKISLSPFFRSVSSSILCSLTLSPPSFLPPSLMWYLKLLFQHIQKQIRRVCFNNSYINICKLRGFLVLAVSRRSGSVLM